MVGKFVAIGKMKAMIIIQYGGDISRKMKLLKRQREGKKKMKQISNVELSKKVFLTILER